MVATLSGCALTSLSAIMAVMATLNIRDIPEEIAAAIDASTTAAKARSRETYLRDLLKERFGPRGSVVAGIAARMRAVVELAESLGRFGVLRPAPSVPVIARAIGHPDPSVLESELRGERPLSFSDGDRLCMLFGIERSWLESGEDLIPRFTTRAKYNHCQVMLYDLIQKGLPYDELYFILTEGEQSVAAIVGHTESEDPAVGWRYDLLVDEIPIHDRVGGTGRAQRREFADLVVALYLDDEVIPMETSLLGRELPHQQYAAMVSGLIHPATATSTYAPGSAQAIARRSDWFEDFRSFGKDEKYTRGYAEGRAALFEHLRRDRITNDDQYEAAMRKRVKDWKARAPREQVNR
jgi:hypothetical protein